MLRAGLRAVMRHYPLLSGCGTVSNMGPFVSASEGLESSVLTTTRFGAAIWVQPQDYIGRAVYFAGDLDAKISWLCRRLLRPGDTAIDIGANFGLVTLLMANRVGSRGTVHAFEPQPELAAMIERSVAENGYTHAHVHAVALSDSDSEATLSIPVGNRGKATLESGEGGNEAHVSIPVRKAGDYLASLSLGAIRLIKIDVEGHEATLLRGAAEYLGTHSPDFILFELNDVGGDFWTRPTVTAISEWGYDFYEIPKCYVRMRLPAVREGDGYVPSGHDYLAVHRGADVPEGVRRAFVNG